MVSYSFVIFCFGTDAATFCIHVVVTRSLHPDVVHLEATMISAAKEKRESTHAADEGADLGEIAPEDAEEEEMEEDPEDPAS